MKAAASRNILRKISVVMAAYQRKWLIKGVKK